MMLEIFNVDKRFGNKIIFQDANIRILPGERVALIGKNGIGKTTLFKMIVGIIKPDQGMIKLNGKDLYQHPKERKKIGYVPVDSFFYEKLTVKENLELICSLYRVMNASKEIKKYSNLFGALDFLNEPVGNLSSGMKKRVSFISGMIHNPEILILDEPFNALDLKTVNILKDQLNQFHGTLIFTSHLPETIYGIANHLLFLDDHFVIKKIPIHNQTKLDLLSFIEKLTIGHPL
ncbi:ABC transporter ATP-binding protein [Bacillus sp. FJAT-47783]|uniref:ABC transporter ATP-binding protein n=1 Tax=Bacillus sp. FJAT-47783 TaxID=2922712 RepID=UPI001FAB698D|nr:ABC transporter ATP-binding protein [Bacillus sp. FJAT-47783]